MFAAVCGDGFEAARAYGEGSAGGDAAVYSEEVGPPLFFFWGRVEREAESKPQVCERALISCMGKCGFVR